MKRIIVIFVALALVLAFCSVAVFAEEINDDVADETPVMEESQPSESEDVDFWTRIVEAWDKGDILQLASLAGTAFMLLLMFFLKKGIISLGSAVVGVANKSNATVDAGVDVMEEAAKNTEKKLSEYGDKIQESLASLGENLQKSTVKEEQIKHIETLLVTLIKMFDNVYQHSKTIAAATKEQLAEDYNAAMKVYNTDVNMEEP